MYILDLAGTLAFAISGAFKARDLFQGNGHGIITALACIFMGMVTGFGGGVIRDAVMGDVPFAFHKKSGYIMSAFLGTVVFYVLMLININSAIIASIATTIFLREIISEHGIYKKIIKNKFLY